ncbi:MAG: hypothetical protein KKE17_10430 [Proteobacteria bacterium]|nr:hypothetical protein [Pseudomonadota bacterium]MBU1710407.1 hypothetical protein [Pseudomonadota bacterium]
MNPAFFKILGGGLCFFGALVSIVFWIPGIVNRRKLKEILGPKYPMIFFIYGANGPFLLLLGLLLVYLAWTMN